MGGVERSKLAQFNGVVGPSSSYYIPLRAVAEEEDREGWSNDETSGAVEGRANEDSTWGIFLSSSLVFCAIESNRMRAFATGCDGGKTSPSANGSMLGGVCTIHSTAVAPELDPSDGFFHDVTPQFTFFTQPNVASLPYLSRCRVSRADVPGCR